MRRITEANQSEAYERANRALLDAERKATIIAACCKWGTNRKVVQSEPPLEKSSLRRNQSIGSNAKLTSSNARRSCAREDRERAGRPLLILHGMQPSPSLTGFDIRGSGGVMAEIAPRFRRHGNWNARSRRSAGARVLCRRFDARLDDEDVIATALGRRRGPTLVLLERAIDAVVWCERREIEADDLRREMVERRDRYRARAVAIRDLIEKLLNALETTVAAPSSAALISAPVRNPSCWSTRLFSDEYVPNRTAYPAVADPRRDRRRQGSVAAVLSSQPPSCGSERRPSTNRANFLEA